MDIYTIYGKLDCPEAFLNFFKNPFEATCIFKSESKELDKKFNSFFYFFSWELMVKIQRIKIIIGTIFL